VYSLFDFDITGIIHIISLMIEWWWAPTISIILLRWWWKSSMLGEPSQKTYIKGVFERSCSW
jgi:hypothetical protein